jgi:chromatin remodeling complex protein RSC6
MATKTAAAPKAAAKTAPKAAEAAAPEKKPGALAAPMKPSAELAAVIGAGPYPRSDITKLVWEYIKKNNLQDATNKRLINADAKFKKVIGVDQIDMMKMTGLVSKHMTKA